MKRRSLLAYEPSRSRRGKIMLPSAKQRLIKSAKKELQASLAPASMLPRRIGHV